MIDLHAHSIASDGTDSPEQLIQKAADAGLSAIALTDHDTIAGIRPAEKMAQKLGIEFIPGCEISTSTAEGRFHILGLWVPSGNEKFDAYLQHLKDMRKIRNEKIISRFNDFGIPITLKDVEAEAHGSQADYEPSIGRPHFAAALMRKGLVNSRSEAFAKWIGEQGLAYVPKAVPHTEEAIQILAAIGALPILAHPFLKLQDEATLDHLLPRLKQNGLAGIEVWHSKHSQDQVETLQRLAKKHDLGVSGGSDYHGLNKPAIHIGTGENNLRIPYQVLDDLKMSLKRGRSNV